MVRRMELGLLAGVGLVQLPVIVVTLAGIVLVALRWQSLRRSAGLAVAGCSLLFVGTIVNMAWVLGAPELYQRGSSATSFGVAAFAVGMLLSLIHAAGIALLVTAVLVGRRPAGEIPNYAGAGSSAG